ncbi:15559_t:CDS:2, partial [Dentiscutata heterogama]
MNAIISHPKINVDDNDSKDYEKAAVDGVANNISDASSNYLPFGQIIEIFYKLEEDIISSYKNAEYNIQLCGFLIKRVNIATAAIRDLEIRKFHNLEFFAELSNLQLFKEFLKCILEIRNFIKNISNLGGIAKYFQTNIDIIKKYKDLSNMFDQCMESLNFSISIRFNKDLNKEIQFIKKELMELKEIMRDMTGGIVDKKAFLKINEIRELNDRYQRELCKKDNATITIEPLPLLDINQYELKYEYKLRKNVHCRWNDKNLLEYAFKEIPSPSINEQQIIHEFYQEITILKKLNSDHITKFYGVAKSNDLSKYYLVTEWMENGMAYLNAVNILHNDIRGKNILIDRNHKAKIANIVFKSNYTPCDGRVQLDFFEKVRYMAPEKLEHGEKQRYNIKCEIYSLGALLWEIAEEEIPYTKEKLDFPTILNRVVKDNYREPFSKNVPKVWQDIVNEALSYNPSFRPPISRIFRVLNDYLYKKCDMN